MGVAQRQGSSLSWVMMAGLLLLLLGERLIGDTPEMRMALSGLGVVALLVAAGWRASVWSRAESDRRSVQGLLALGADLCRP